MGSTLGAASFLSHTQYSEVGSRFSGNNMTALRGQPPRMLCYRPGMSESNIVDNMEQYMMKEINRMSLRDSNNRINSMKFR